MRWLRAPRPRASSACSFRRSGRGRGHRCETWRVAAPAVPDALLLAETDAPDQAPERHRGRRSEPAFVANVIAGLAAARATTTDAISTLTTTNARRIFAGW